MRFLYSTTKLLIFCALTAIAGQTQQAPAGAAKPGAILPQVAPSTVTTTGGTSGRIAYFTGTTTLLPTSLYYNATGLGIGKLPSTSLDVNGNAVIRGSLDVARTGDATTAKGFPSYPFILQATAYNSGTKIIDSPIFELQAKPTGNNTATTGAALHFLFNANETGLYINPNGTINFSPSQTFPIASGPQGLAGPQGPAGPQGATGPAGGLDLPYIGYNTTFGSAPSNAFTIQNFDDLGGTAIVGTGGNSGFDYGGDGVVGNGGQGGNISGGAGVRGYGGASEGHPAGGSMGGPGIYGQGGGIGSSAGGGDKPGLAGQFVGDVQVTGNLSKAGGSFKIDDPLDPANKYLSHSFVESPDMMNIYNGNVTTDGTGEAVVTLPRYFDSLNRDFRYQLTVIGQPAQAYVATEISGDVFVIKTDKAGVKVSWQVTGIRQDAWANAHRIPNEEEKPATERGRYLHPELYGHKGELAVNERRPSKSNTGAVSPASK